MNKIISKSHGELPSSSFRLNGKDIPFQCSYDKIPITLPGRENDLIRYEITCKFDKVVPIFNMDLRDMRMILDKKTVRMFFPTIGELFAPPSELLYPIDKYQRIREIKIEEEKQMFLDEGRVAPEEYIEELIEDDHQEVLTEFTFGGKIARMKESLWKKGEITHKTLYSDMSDEEREERFLMEDVYWAVKKIIGSAQLVEVDWEKNEIIGGPF